MDKFDYIILASLSENCRMPLSKIGKKIRRSPQFVKYRIEQLKKNTIKQISFITNFYKQGFEEVTAMIKFPIINPLIEKIFIDFLFKKKETYKLFSISGSNSILCSFIVKDLKEVFEIKKELLSIAPFDINFFVNYKSEIYSHDYFGEYRPEKKIVIEKSDEEVKMGRVLKKSLVELQKNPFISNLEISNNIKESYDRVNYAMNNDNLVVGNNLILSNQVTSKAFIFMKVSDLKKVSDYSNLQKNIVETNFFVGKDDVLINVETISKLKQTTKKILFDLKNIIQEYEVIESTNTYKYGWFN